MRMLIAVFTLLFATLAAADDHGTPVGLWKTIDDKTKLARSHVRIVEVNGVLEGRIEKLLNRQPDDDPDNLCRACTGDRKDKPILGMKILWGLKHDDGVWEDGEILDPKNGKTYRCKMKVVDGGAKLDVRGFIGISLIGRTQTWVREE